MRHNLLAVVALLVSMCAVSWNCADDPVSVESVTDTLYVLDTLHQYDTTFVQGDHIYTFTKAITKTMVLNNLDTITHPNINPNIYATLTITWDTPSIDNTWITDAKYTSAIDTLWTWSEFGPIWHNTSVNITIDGIDIDQLLNLSDTLGYYKITLFRPTILTKLTH